MVRSARVACISAGTTFRCTAGVSRKCFGVSRFTYRRHRNIEVRSQKPELRRKKSPACTQRFRNEGGRVLDHASEIAPTSWHFSTNLACSGFRKYPQSHAKSSHVSVSAFSPSASVSLLTKCASYLRFAQASRRFVQTDRDERRIWSISEYFSSTGNR